MADNEFTLPMDYEPTEDISVNAVQATEDPGKFLQEGSGPAVVETSLDKVSDAGTASKDWLVESFAQAATGTFNSPDLWKNRKPTTVEEIGRSLVHGFTGSVKSTLSGVVKTAAYAEAAMEDAEHGLAELIVGRSFPNRNFGRALIHSMNEKERSEAWERTLYENRQGIKSDAWYNMLASAFGSSATLFGAAVAGVPGKTLAGAEGLMIGASYFSEQSSKLESAGESGAKALPFAAFVGTLGGLIAKTGGETIISDAVQNKFGPAAVSFARGATDNLVKRISKRLLNPVAKKAAKAEAIEELTQEVSTIGTEKIQDVVLGTQVNQSTWQEDVQRMLVGLAGGAAVGGLVGEYVYNKNLNQLQKKLEPVFDGDKDKAFEAATAIADAVLNEAVAENAAVKSLEGHVADLNPELAQVLSHVFEDLVNQGFVNFRQATPDEVRQAGLDWANLMSAAAILDAMERNIPLRTHPLFNAIAEIDRILLEGRDPSTGDLLPLDINNAQVRELANQIEDYIVQNRETRQAEEASKLAALREADMRARQQTIQELERAAIAELEKEQAANNQERIIELQQQIAELQHQMDLLREEQGKYAQERAAQGRISIKQARAQETKRVAPAKSQAELHNSTQTRIQIFDLDVSFATTQAKEYADKNINEYPADPSGHGYDSKDFARAVSDELHDLRGESVGERFFDKNDPIRKLARDWLQNNEQGNTYFLTAQKAANELKQAELAEQGQPQSTPEQAAQIPQVKLPENYGDKVSFTYRNQDFEITRGANSYTVALLIDKKPVSRITVLDSGMVEYLHTEEGFERRGLATEVVLVAEQLFGPLTITIVKGNTAAEEFWFGLGYTNEIADRTYTKAIAETEMYHQDQVVKKVGEDRTNADKWLKEQKKVVDAAVDYYGLTDDINEAGYILPDGGLLDFSGKGMGGMPGRRAFDHREIAAAFDEEVIGKPSPFPELVVMEEFINAGNIRFLPESGTFLMAHKPTPAQYRTIERVMDQRNGEIQIEFVSDAEKWGSHIAENFYYETPEFSSIQDVKRLANAFFDGTGITQDMLTLSEADYYYQNTAENPVLVDVEDIASDWHTGNVLDLVLSGQNMWDNLIDPAKYKNALLEFVKNGQLLRTKTEDVEQWFETIVRNTALLDNITDIVGHSAWFPETEIKEYFFGTDRAEADRKFQEYKKQLQNRDEELPPEFAGTESTADEEMSDMAVLWKLLEDKGFFDNARLPDGSPAWSDYGLRPLWDIIGEYREGMSAEQVLVLINKALDVYHQNGDLVSAFIKGGAEVADQISNDISQESVQFQDQPQAKLIATHNMSKEGLERALDLGGLVMPSMAITKFTDGPFIGYGEISFIGDAILANPTRTTDAYDRDAWTPMVNNIVYRFTEGGVERLKALVEEAKQKNPRDTNSYSVYRMNIERNMSDDPRANTMAVELFSILHDIPREQARQNITYNWGEEKTEMHKQYLEWFNDKLLAETKAFIYEGYTPSGKIRLKPLTLDNLTAALKKQDRFGRMTGDFFTPSDIIKMNLVRFKNIGEIRDAQGRLVSRDEAHEAYKEIGSDFYNLASELNKHNVKESTYTSSDQRLAWALIIEKGTLEERLAKQNLKNDAESVKKVKKFIKDVKNIKVPYFEVKPRRAVKFYEFSGVILPKGESYDNLAARLEEEGVLNIYRATTPEEKTAALKDLTEKRPWTLLQNKKTSKSTTGLGTEHRGGYDPMTKAIIFNKTSDLTTLFHESAHYWFDRNLRYYRTGLASPEWKKKWEDVMNELGATPNARGTIPVSAIRSASEKFARSMEAYLREGKYESAAIQWAHQDYANMVKRVYRNIWSTYWGLDDLSPAVKQWFDMFGLKTDDATTAFAEEDQIETDEQMVGAVIAEDATEPDVDAETKTIVADAGAQVVENPATQEIAIVPADPFETGKKARSKLPRSAEAATGVSMDDIIYNRRSMSDAFKAAQQLVNTDPVRAWEILKGGQEMVDGLYAGDIYRALVAKYQAENNPTMLKNVVQAFAGAARRAGRSVKAFDLESPRISFEKTINSLDKIFDTKKNDKRIEKVKNELKEFLHDPSALRVGWEEFKNIVGCK